MNKKSKKVLTGSVASLAALVMTAAPALAATTAVAQRPYAGVDRVDTALKVSNNWTSSKVAVLAPGNQGNLVDALTAAPLAKAYDAPILLTEGNKVSDATLTQMKKLGVEEVFIASGILNNVKATLEANGVKTIHLLGGADRQATAKNIADAVVAKTGKIGGAMIIGYNGAPDALSAASIAAKEVMPIFFANPDAKGVPASVTDFLATNKTAKTYVLGGTGVVADSVKDKLSAKRLGGATRYDSAVAILNEFKSTLDMNNVYIAEGEDHYVDALAISAVAGKTEAPIVIVSSNASSKATTDFLKANLQASSNLVMMGGTGAVSADLEAAVVALKPVVKEAKVTDVQVSPGITGFDRYVEVKVSTPDPLKTTVTYGSTKLEYNAQKGVFFGVITVSTDELAKDMTKYTVKYTGAVTPTTDAKVSDVAVSGGITTFDRYVEVKVTTADASKTTVAFGSTQLTYNADKGFFYGVIPAASDDAAKDFTKYTVKYTGSVAPAPAPTPVTNAKLGDVTVSSGITGFDRYVEVKVTGADDLSKVSVMFGNTTLTLNKDKGFFYGVVPASTDDMAKDATKYTVK